LLSRGGFAIRQWASNNKRIVNDLSSNEIHMNFLLNEDQTLKTLGLTWDTQNDRIYYSAYLFKNTGKITKYVILPKITKIFSNLLGPIILYAKRLMQDVWRSGIQWDESVPQNIYTE